MHLRTGGQPFLLQVYGSVLISMLNKEHRTVATAQDVSAAEVKVIEWAKTFFNYHYSMASANVRTALEAMARGQAVDLGLVDRRWLIDHNLLTPDQQLAVPVFGVWIEDYTR